MVKLRVFSPNSSCALLRNIPFRNRVLLRLGSTTPLVSRYKYLELNTIEGVKTSGNKISMKRAFDEAGIIHSEWICSSKRAHIYDFFKKHKILIAKHKHSSKGKNIYYIDSLETLESICNDVNIQDFVFEKYYFFLNEYRVHVDVNHGCFYACKKILKPDAEVQWHKHADNSVFALIREDFKVPACWEKMINDCIKALKQMKLTIACFDVLCSDDNYIIVESNTAPSLASYGITYYSNHLKKYYDTKL